MAIEVRPCRDVDELRRAVDAISHYFGNQNSPEDMERFVGWLPVDRMHAAFDGDEIVGGAGAFPFRMPVPGGADVAAGGTTVVGVLPTHRRRGVLTQLMRAQLDDIHERGELLAYLWASEATIYPRFGYGLASMVGKMTLSKERTRFALPFEPRGVARFVDADEAAKLFPPLYEQVRRQRPGMFERSAAWWETRRLYYNPERSHGNPPLNRVVMEVDGTPVAYALYRVKQDWVSGVSAGTVTVVEVIAPDGEGAREMWRWLLDFDWTSQFVADLLPLDHELFLLLAEPRRMKFELNDGVWVRLIDVEAALAARSYEGDGSIDSTGEVVLEVTDALCPWNEGRYAVSAAGVERVERSPDLGVDVTSLGSVFLGGFSFASLKRSQRVKEFTNSAIPLADRLFGTFQQPWCPEIF
ncbi:MAG TPA: GNAT family N-acetyltransferase [Gaiellaceae bacterium]|jgi:predicted acetyltransferase